jgi:ribosomal protein S27AE
MTCADDSLDDFEYISGEGYIHTDYISYCPRCGEAFISDSYYFSYLDFYESEVTDEMYCSEYCMEREEEDYKRENWYYSDYDQEYYEDEDDIATYKRGECDEITISVESGDNLVEEGEAVKIDDVYVNLEYLRELLSL